MTINNFLIYFRNKFPQIPSEVEGQGKEVGEVAIVELPEGTIINLITKKKFDDKPKYFDVWLCLKNLRAYLDGTSHRSLALPRIASGLDRLEWRRIKFMLSYIFS